ncbi:MAG: hypothetical protein LUE26_04285 [Alistipes sp.]|nr:hypothetical protein [Alistipes sp.]
MSAYLPMILMIGIVVIGWLLWMTVFQKKFSAKYAAMSGEVQKKFEENKDEIINSYLTGEDKYGILTKAVGDDEKVLGIASYVEPKTVGKSLTEGIKTSITKVRKVNMDMFYMVITDKNLHAIESNGKNTVDHTVFALENIENAKYSKASPINVKNAVTGVSGDLNSFSFTYKGEKYQYNMYKIIAGYAMFTVTKTGMDEHYTRSFPGITYTKVGANDPDFLLENMINMHIYGEFCKAVKEKLGVTVP